jgi:hypothetical protein
MVLTTVDENILDLQRHLSSAPDSDSHLQSRNFLPIPTTSVISLTHPYEPSKLPPKATTAEIEGLLRGVCKSTAIETDVGGRGEKQIGTSLTRHLNSERNLAATIPTNHTHPSSNFWRPLPPNSRPNEHGLSCWKNVLWRFGPYRVPQCEELQLQNKMALVLYFACQNWSYVTTDDRTKAFGGKTSKMIQWTSKPTRTWRMQVFWDVTPCGSCKNRRLGGD